MSLVNSTCATLQGERVTPVNRVIHLSPLNISAHPGYVQLVSYHIRSVHAVILVHVSIHGILVDTTFTCISLAAHRRSTTPSTFYRSRTPIPTLIHASFGRQSLEVAPRTPPSIHTCPPDPGSRAHDHCPNRRDKQSLSHHSLFPFIPLPYTTTRQKYRPIHHTHPHCPSTQCLHLPRRTSHFLSYLNAGCCCCMQRLPFSGRKVCYGQPWRGWRKRCSSSA